MGADGVSDAGSTAAATTASHAALCTACGLCCDGSLFDAVRVKPAEIAPLRELGMPIEPGESAQFSQPCPKLAERKCSIYANRPGTCRNFACALLRRLRRSEVALDEALHIVATAQSLRDKVAATMPAGASTAAWMGTEPDAAWSEIADPAARRSAARRHLDQVVLCNYLTKHFRTVKEKVGTGGGDSGGGELSAV